jgi:hypothetical protein
MRWKSKEKQRENDKKRSQFLIKNIEFAASEIWLSWNKAV